MADDGGWTAEGTDKADLDRLALPPGGSCRQRQKRRYGNQLFPHIQPLQ
jgi:hypothetical protein